MVRPTVADVKSLSKVEFSDYGFNDDADLAPYVEMANAYVERVTGRLLDASMPANLEPLAMQAVKMRTEQVARQAEADYVEGAADDIVGSFSVGGYSESRHDPTRRGETRALNSWPALQEILLLLATTDLYEFWIAYMTGQHLPASVIEEVLWRNTPGVLGYGLAGVPVDDFPQWNL